MEVVGGRKAHRQVTAIRNVEGPFNRRKVRRAIQLAGGAFDEDRTGVKTPERVP